jgi:hypothetical protein
VWLVIWVGQEYKCATPGRPQAEVWPKACAKRHFGEAANYLNYNYAPYKKDIHYLKQHLKPFV